MREWDRRSEPWRLAAALLLAGSVSAQTPPPADPAAAPVAAAPAAPPASATPEALQPLKRGQLVVWVIRPDTSRPSAAAIAAGASAVPTTVPAVHPPEPGYHETTPSGLGQSASSYGQSAGSYGVDADSPLIGTPPSGQVTNAAGARQTLAPGYGEATPSTLAQAPAVDGTAAGDYGQTAGSFGTAASNTGQTAGSYGQTAGSFGGSIGATVGNAPLPRQAAAHVLEDVIEPQLKADFPDLRTRFLDGEAGRLRAALRTAETNRALPDVLIFEGFPPNWAGPAPEVRALEASSAGGYQPEPFKRGPGNVVTPQALVLRRAPHPRQAQAFLDYLQQQNALTQR